MAASATRHFVRFKVPEPDSVDCGASTSSACSAAGFSGERSELGTLTVDQASDWLFPVQRVELCGARGGNPAASDGSTARSSRRRSRAEPPRLGPCFQSHRTGVQTAEQPPSNPMELVGSGLRSTVERLLGSSSSSAAVEPKLQAVEDKRCRIAKVGTHIAGKPRGGGGAEGCSEQSEAGDEARRRGVHTQLATPQTSEERTPGGRHGSTARQPRGVAIHPAVQSAAVRAPPETEPMAAEGAAAVTPWDLPAKVEAPSGFGWSFPTDEERDQAETRCAVTTPPVAAARGCFSLAQDFHEQKSQEPNQRQRQQLQEQGDHVLSPVVQELELQEQLEQRHWCSARRLPEQGVAALLTRESQPRSGDAAARLQKEADESGQARDQGPRSDIEVPQTPRSELASWHSRTRVAKVEAWTMDMLRRSLRLPEMLKQLHGPSRACIPWPAGASAAALLAVLVAAGLRSWRFTVLLRLLPAVLVAKRLR